MRVSDPMFDVEYLIDRWMKEILVLVKKSILQNINLSKKAPMLW